jgi:hypothetical protein
MNRLGKTLNRFWREEQGSVMVEALLVLPAMIWAYAGMFAYWDSYQSINTVQKATFTISDLISRQQDDLSSGFINGIGDTLDYLLNMEEDAKMRVTSYTWSEVNNRYQVIWSVSPDGGFSPLTTASIANLTSRLPIMSDGDSAVLVESSVYHTPPIHFGIEPSNIEQFVVARPRYLPKICHVDFDCG